MYAFVEFYVCYLFMMLLFAFRIGCFERLRVLTLVWGFGVMGFWELFGLTFTAGMIFPFVRLLMGLRMVCVTYMGDLCIVVNDM